MIHPELTKIMQEGIGKRPHVVILGAGASKAICPSDKNGKPLPTMNELSSILNLKSLCLKHGIDYGDDNFETLYSSLYEKPGFDNLINEVESLVFNYFIRLELPKGPTIYDRLIMSLRPKDVIATFNWDPLLFQAFLRCEKVFKSARYLPKILFLHGSVSVGYCEQDLVMAPLGGKCPECGVTLKPTKLLYPIEKKNYQDNSIIQASWDDLKTLIKSACFITIFGYGAPKSDVEAIELMKNAFKDNEVYELINVEIIDIKNIEELSESWSTFYSSPSRGMFSKSFKESYIYKYPRRSTEAIYLPTVMGEFPPQDKEMKITKSIDTFVKEFVPLIEEEKVAYSQDLKTS